MFGLELITIKKGISGNKTFFRTKSSAEEVLFRHFTVQSLAIIKYTLC